MGSAVRIAAAVLVLLAGTGGRAHAEANGAPRERILITAFDPFGGSDRNNSWDIARAIEDARDVYGDDVEIVLCRLPVVYDQGAAAAKACYESMEPKPTTVISLGEAGCSVRLETAAHNLDDTPGFPDNDGQIRNGNPILPDAPASIGFDLPVQEMFCSVSPDDADHVTVSETPGGFVCNNTSFHLANYFAGEDVQYGFVHVPNSRCSEERRDPVRNGRILAGMIRTVVDYDREEVPETHVMPHCSNEARLPTDRSTLDGLLGALEDVGAKECEQEFLRALRERL